MSSKNLTIGLFGFGVVGEGIYRVLQQTPTLNATIKKICIKNEWKKRDIAENIFTTSPDELLDDPDINVIVELINDADDAFRIVAKALRNGKAVVSANKKLIAEHFEELLELQRRHNTPFLYEAAVAGSIPIIRNLEEYYDNDLLRELSGVINGSTNYILTKMIDEGQSYRDALIAAQQLGFAETDPTLDVDGYDPANKLIILLAHAYGIIETPDKLVRKGITQVHRDDTRISEEKNFELKLVAQARKLSNGSVAAFVLPQFIQKDSQLGIVKNEFNGIVIESSFSDKQFLYGKGAGRYPTSSAVLSDISALRYNYRYEYRKLSRQKRFHLSTDFYLKVYVSFTDWSQVSRDDFEWIEEYHGEESRQYLIGVIHVQNLRTSEWFEDPSVSVILCPDGIIEDLELRNLRKRSLELAGVA